MLAPWQTRSVTLLMVACAACSPAPAPPADISRPAATDAANGATSASSELRRRSPFSLDDRALWRAALAWPESCEESFSSSRAGQDGGLAVHNLAARVSIVEILCASGAYQPSHVFVRYDEQGASPMATLLEFPVLMSDDGESIDQSVEREVWGETWFSPDAFEMSVLTVSRQLGDCGIWSRYALSGQQPVLTNAAARLPCPSSPAPPVQFTNGNAPVGWRSLSVPK